MQNLKLYNFWTQLNVVFDILFANDLFSVGVGVI